MCDHRYVYQGVGYCDGKWSLPGGGACTRYYAHLYFCERCLDLRGQPFIEKLKPSRHTTYHKVEFGATPVAAGIVGVPMEDQ